ncbi:MAG: ribonuclease III, partial [Prevotella sp.]|nr:ribonuclease III [Prevotella sp.]
GSPVFGFMVMLEGVEGSCGQGFSKKEAQQEASRETLQRLRREPQFIDAIFQAKSERTKMEEEPTAVAPDLEAEKTNFIIEQKSVQTEEPTSAEEAENDVNAKRNKEKDAELDLSSDEFSLSDITHQKERMTREEIIAAAEAAAFASKL